MSTPELGYGCNSFEVGQRVELSPHLDRWMMGDRMGIVTGFATWADGVSTDRSKARWRDDGRIIYAVKLDVSGKRLKIASSNIIGR